LGFGFGALNVERLGLKEIDAKKATATAHGFTAAEIAGIRKKFDNRVELLTNVNIDDLFRHHVAWD
jgi:hypothetical protein